MTRRNTGVSAGSWYWSVKMRKLGGTTYNTRSGDYDLARRMAELSVAVNMAASALRIGNLDEALVILERARAGDAKTPLTTQRILNRHAQFVKDQPLALSAREREVLSLASKGLQTSDIARQLSISHYTVKSHLRKIYKVLGVRNRAAAVSIALRTENLEDAV